MEWLLVIGAVFSAAVLLPLPLVLALLLSRGIPTRGTGVMRAYVDVWKTLYQVTLEILKRESRP
jgi:hypothetical protein